MMARRLLKIADHPICPRCEWDQFDDWWHALKERPKHQPGGRLTCGDCEKLFFIEGVPGNIFSSCFGVRRNPQEETE
jgi:hypothetical protein